MDHGSGGGTQALARPHSFKAKGKFTDPAKGCFRQSRRANIQKFSPVGADHGGATLDTKPRPTTFKM